MDVITYCVDPAALVAEVAEKCPELLVVDEQDPEFHRIGPLTKTPTVRNASGATLALCRNLPQQLADLDSLQVLGTYEEIFADPDKLALYDSVYDRTEKTTVDPETGEVSTFKPPDKIGVFA